jgi:hypothetical protein
VRLNCKQLNPVEFPLDFALINETTGRKLDGNGHASAFGQSQSLPGLFKVFDCARQFFQLTEQPPAMSSSVASLGSNFIACR